MFVPDASAILALAERGAGLGPARRALLLLEAAYPEHAPEAIADAALSVRDRALLAVRAGLFGAGMAARDACEGCGALLELGLSAEAIGLGALDEPFPPAPSARLGGGAVIRAVTSGDAAAAEAAADAAAARAVIATRAAPGAADDDRLDAALEALDPGADVEIALACPGCGATTVRAFDAPVFVWREIEARVPRILRDVAELARAFHWSERDILALPPARRAFYLAEARG